MTGSIRRMAEIALGPMRVRRQLPKSAGGGRLVASARVGGLKYLFRSARLLDPELLRVAGLLVRNGDVVWDVGANVGLFSVAAAAIAGVQGRVISIEADIDAVALLNTTAQMRIPGHAEMTVLPVAVSATCGFVQFQIAARARAANAIAGYGSTQMGGIREVRTLPSVTLNELLNHFPPPNILKIDVEGAECDVLRGAENVLSVVRPRIYCEVAGHAAEEVTSILHRHKYRIWDGAYFDGRLADEIDLATDNSVAIPEEKANFV